MCWRPFISWIFLATVTTGSLAGVQEQIARLQDESIAEPERLKVLVELGKAGPASREALPAIELLANDRSRSINVRGYATWALATIAPPPADYAGREYHVAAEHPEADDANPGTAEKPWKTIQSAAERLRPGDTVLIHNGIYREMVRPMVSGEPERYITYRAAPAETPVIRGSDLWETQWKDEGGGVWSTPYDRHAWDKPEKWPSPLKGPAFRCEQIFVDGQFLTHVATRDALRKPNTFYTVDDGAHGTLYIHPTDGAPPDQRVIERSMRQHCFFPAVQGLGYIRVEGLTMQHTAGPEFSKDWGLHGARPVMSVRAGHYWIIEDNIVEWGNAQGIDIGAWAWGETGKDDPYAHDDFGHHQVRRNRANHNAVSGICGTDAVRYNILEDNETSYNGHKQNFYGYETAGLKLHSAKHTLIRRHVSKDNFGFGIWLDWDCNENRVTECILTGNMGGGFFLEATAGPVLVDSNVIIGTRDAPPPPHHDDHPWGDGIYGHDANRLIAVHNYITDCDGFAVRVRNLFGRKGPGDKLTTTSHNRIFNNFLVDNGRGAVCFNPEVPLSKDNKSDFNILWQKGPDVQFRLQRTGSEVDWTKTLIGRRLKLSGDVHATIPLTEWRTTLKQDVHSELDSPQELFADLTSEQIRDRLVAMSRDLKIPSNENELKPRPVKQVVQEFQEAQ